MAIERERKFLCHPDICRHLQGKYEVVYTLNTLYFVGGKNEVRIRRKGELGYVLTLKQDINVEHRYEVELPVPVHLVDDLISMCRTRLSKRRYEIQGWELDVFFDELDSLVILEREMALTDELPEFPEWMRPFIIREVTDDLRYRSGQLAQNGIPT
jgi:CYTH domain-containing protein